MGEEAGPRPPLLSWCVRRRFRARIAQEEGPGRSGAARPGGAHGRVSELDGKWVFACGDLPDA